LELRGLSSDGFESACATLLRKLGFEEVKVTGGPNDGGLDGVATLKHSGVLSARVYFQCKRFAEDTLVTASDIRDFRGGMSGKPGVASVKGLYITTSRLTANAKETAATGEPIDYIEGDQLVELMLSNGLGAKQVWTIDSDWFGLFEKDKRNT